MRPEIDIEFLRTLLRYEPETGKLFWLHRPVTMFKDGGHTASHSCAKWNSKHGGKEAFTSLSEGRPHGRIFRKAYYASRTAWALTHGYWPIEVDHIDHDKANNRLTNLREATHAQNLCNQSPARGSTSIFLGVHWDQARMKWVAQISPCRRHIYLGRFASEVDAARAYDAAALQHFGTFANLNFPQERATA